MLAGPTGARADELVASLRNRITPVDAAALTGEFAEDLASEFRQAIETVVDGWLDGKLALTRPSSFDLADFAVLCSSGRAATTRRCRSRTDGGLAARIPV